MEKTVVRISSFFIGAYNFDDAINQSFELLCKRTKADRICLYRMHHKAKLIHLTHEHISKDNNPVSHAPSSIPFDQIQWWLQQLRIKEFVHADDTTRLPEQALNEKDLFTGQGIRSIASFPLFFRSRLYGFISLDHMKTAAKWDPSELEILKLAADIISFSIERKRSESSLRKTERMYEKIFENTGAATLTMKTDSTILMVNSQFEQLTAYPRSEAGGKLKFFDLVSPHDQSIINKYLTLLRTNPEAAPEHYEFHYSTRQGESRTAFMTGSAMIDAKTVVVSFIDITEFKHAEEELLTAKQKAEESDRLKSAFLSNVSHEIRTPLNAITGFSTLLSSPNLPVDKREKYIKQIQSGSTELVSLIDNVLDISRIESGTLKPKFTEFLINMTLKELLDFYEDMKLQMNKENLQISLKLPESSDKFLIRTDQMRLQQILTNLIDNAIKFTSSGTVEFGYSSLSDQPGPGKEENILFFVRDTGIGISKKNKERVFERFVKIVDKSDFLYRGAGLGLTLCRDLVQMLKGEIWVESNLGKGSTFYFTLPIRQPKPEGDKVSPEKKARLDFSDKTILIAEDTESNYLYLKEILNSTHVNIIRALDGKEAVKLYREQQDRIDLILMDILMPGLDGFEASNQIRRINNHVRIIAQTAFTFEGEIENDLYAGCFDDYILKPFDVKVIRKLIEKYLMKQD